MLKTKPLLAAALALAGFTLVCGSACDNHPAGTPSSASSPPPASEMTINGAGATFPNPLYSKWFDAYRKVDPSVQINYQAIGSGGGQKQISEQTVDFGASDGPMSDESLAKVQGGKLLHLPTVAGAVVITFNVPGVTDLKLDGPTIANIFLGKVTHWNDPAIAGQNPGVKLPDQEISTIHRTEGSGTTYIFTDYLSTVSPEWKSKVGKNTSVNWPAGLGAKGNEGVSGQIKQTPGSVGYVELIYALQNKLPLRRREERGRRVRQGDAGFRHGGARHGDDPR